MVSRASRANILTFDVEFASAERYRPLLCLLQLAWVADSGGVEAHLVDAQAVDIRPLVQLLAAPRCVVAHGARQDLALLSSVFGHRVTGLFDTQLAAAFLGLGEQVGYARLVESQLGIALDKEQQWTAWEKRPLTSAQLRYALADVTHLPALHAQLDKELGRLGRREWVEQASAELVEVADSAAQQSADDAWRSLAGWRGLASDKLCVLRELAAWRVREASRLDVPINRIVDERTLVDWARKPPASVRHKRTALSEDEIDAGVRAAVARARERFAAGDAPPAPSASVASAPRAQVWSEIILALVAEAAARHQVAARLIATRDDVEQVARAVDRAGVEAAIHLPLFRGWRNQLCGAHIADWLRGGVGLFASSTAPLGLASMPAPAPAPGTPA